jgi:hypothetical protein
MGNMPVIMIRDRHGAYWDKVRQITPWLPPVPSPTRIPRPARRHA